MAVISNDLREVNSTSYADVAGFSMGLDRLLGENTSDFLARLYSATYARRDHSFQGTVNNITLALGLKVREGIKITCDDPAATIIASNTRITFTSGSEVLISKLLTIEEDTVWKWRMLSDVVADVNASSGFQASLLIDDAPALQLIRQSNIQLEVAEPIAGVRSTLQRSGVIVGTERFSVPVPAYTLSGDGFLTFTSEPPAGLRISYQYRRLPYSMVCSEAGLIGLCDPGVSEDLLSSTGALAYQMRETVQSIMQDDRSYWAK